MAHGFLLVIFVLSHLALLHSAETEERYPPHPSCPPFQCGVLGQISFPFFNATHGSCGLVAVDCNDPDKPKIRLGTEGEGQWYGFTSITRDNTMEVYDPVLEEHLQSNNCSSFNNLTLPNYSHISFTIFKQFFITLFKCTRNPKLNLETERYFRGYHNYSDCNHYDIYYKLPEDNPQSTSPERLPHQCSVIQLPLFHHPTPEDNPQSTPPERLPHQCSIIQLPLFHHPTPGRLFTLLGAYFQLEWHVSEDCQKCYDKGGLCGTGSNGKFRCAKLKGIHSDLVIKAAIATSAAGIGVAVVLVCFFRRRSSSGKSMVFWKKETENHKKVEAFLRNYGSLVPKRYSYSDIKEMTNSFKNKIGQGGYGGVYKGKLHDGRLVAVKVLNESKGNGEEFINEVASISRTSHVNIVTLLGFCFGGSKRALVYEFMPNGSLEKFIYDENPSQTDRKLGWEILYQIAIGIARGLEYLHRGCNTQILHFDIKPHNILLDEDFCPKFSDFGLAKLCPRKESIVSMLGARGTAGYIAPEVFCRNFGGVSHKSDVYSYGMMVLEMIGGRKNINVGADRTSEIYFPHWIYKRLELDEELGLHGIMNEDEKESARKMIIVGLWCIQTDPSNRPPMSKVVDMLEGSLESLKIPPTPFLSSPSRSPAESSTTDFIM